MPGLSCELWILFHDIKFYLNEEINLNGADKALFFN